MGICIFKEYEWKPWANTYMYVKWDWSITDTWKNKMVLSTQNLQFWTEWNLQYIKFPWTSANGFYTTAYNAPLPITYSFLINYDWWWVYWPRLLDNTASNDSWMQICQDRTTPWISINGTTRITTSTNKRYHIVITQDSSWNVKAYKNWGEQRSWTVTTNRYTGIIVWFKKSNSSDYFSWKMAEILIEDVVWDKDAVKNYSNRIMSLYWLS